ncbi:MAG: thiamine phosphate synthase, partial [Janthinobacterium lividum]
MSDEAANDDDELIPLDPGFGERFERQRRPKCQLYLISPSTIDGGFADRLRAALSGGSVAAFQLRLKDVDDAAIVAAAEELIPVCNEFEVAFILNDRAD